MREALADDDDRREAGVGAIPDAGAERAGLGVGAVVAEEEVFAALGIRDGAELDEAGSVRAMSVRLASGALHRAT